MVRITPDMLLKHASHTKKRTNETEIQFLKRLTHIYLQEKGIDEIENLADCKSLSVLYLYDNNISAIRNLSFASNLTHLYLQKNKITHMNGLQCLPKLLKLYLGHNSITVVEGLEANKSLVELHIEAQTLPPGEKLLFDPRSMEAISNSLSVLNVSSNSIDDTGDLRILRRLNHLVIENNELCDWVDLSETLLGWTSLYILDASGNPMCDHKKCRDKLIIMSKSLVMLDKKEVSESTRKFLQNWYANKEAKKKKHSKQRSDSYEMVTDSQDSNRLHLYQPYSSDTLYKLEHGNTQYDFQISSSTHKTKNHKQFSEVLAKAKNHQSIPPLEQVGPK